jgi:hypothetical protein
MTYQAITLVSRPQTYLDIFIASAVLHDSPFRGDFSLHEIPRDLALMVIHDADCAGRTYQKGDDGAWTIVPSHHASHVRICA